MKKSYITVALFIWLFSHQVFATAWAISNSASENCGAYTQSDCVITGYMQHIMPMVGNFDTYSHDKLLMNCDHCSIVCQASIISNPQLLSFNKDQQVFDVQLTDKLLNMFMSSLYRPPIPV
ncbi:MAG: hypothetical protein ACI9ES_001562 [Oceanospirillaceae bacterium]|jgi:hypothetical protein